MTKRRPAGKNLWNCDTPIQRINVKFPHSRSQSGASAGKFIVLIAFIAMIALAAALYVDRQSAKAENQKLRAETAELEALRQQQAELEQLRAQSQQFERLKEDNQELVKLRGEVAALRPLQAQAQKLQTENAQLKTSLQQFQKVAGESATLRAQNEKLQGTLAEGQRAAQIAACVNNLRTIEAAKTAWAVDTKKAPTDIPNDAELFGPNRYIPQRLVCPTGGAYTINAVQQKPMCNIPGHAY